MEGLSHERKVIKSKCLLQAVISALSQGWEAVSADMLPLGRTQNGVPETRQKTRSPIHPTRRSSSLNPGQLSIKPTATGKSGRKGRSAGGVVQRELRAGKPAASPSRGISENSRLAPQRQPRRSGDNLSRSAVTRRWSKGCRDFPATGGSGAGLRLLPGMIGLEEWLCALLGRPRCLRSGLEVAGGGGEDIPL